MPTYLTHEKAPIYSSDSDFWDPDPNNTLGLGKKADASHVVPNPNGDNTNTHRLVIDEHNSNSNSAPSHDRFEESSFSSTHASDVSDSLPSTQMNGLRPTSMNSLRDGKGLAGGEPSNTAATHGTPSGNKDGVSERDHADFFGGDRHDRQRQQASQYTKPRDSNPTTLNGHVKMPDRAAPPPPPAANGSTSTSAKYVNNLSSRQNDQQAPRTSVGSVAASSVQQSLADASPKPGRISDGGAPTESSSMITPQSDPPPGSAASTTSLAVDSKSQASAQRFSSPPLYHTTSGTTSTSNSLQVPPNTGIKQRHTLEVPKIQPPRTSKDGSEAAYASGRFSPTTTAAGVRRASLSLARRNTRSIQSDAPRDEVVPDEDALRWAEAYRQKRASKRKKREEEDDDRVVVGTKVDEHHANWVTAYNMLTGIRVSVSRTNAKLDRPLTDADFEAKQKSTFDIAGNELVPSAKYDFKFKDYAPWVFRHLRALFRLDPADYLMSLTGKYILSELGSPGKSGSFFYFSRDYKYIIKTIHHGEHKFLRKILKDYYQHVTDNPNTLLSQFYGLHRVKMPYGKKIHFVVMNNLFPPHRDIHSTFDLKGSTIGRDYQEEDLENNPRATMKDLNWLRRQRALELGLQKKRLFLEQLNRDVALLKKLQIMDYSLLVGIHDLQRGNEENLRGKTLQVFNPGGDGVQDDSEPQSVLLRTPSKLESARKAKELRQMIRQERPVPVGETAIKMPDELDEAHNRAGFIFNQDDGGLRATHEDNSPADEIYYLGVIDCLTHYGMVKKIEHFWKGLTSDRSQISALPPAQYGDRFYHFIEGITLSPEELQREKQRKEQEEIEAAAEQENQRVSSWRSSTSRRKSAVPPMPTHLPPPTPMPSGQLSPKAKQTIEKATHEANKTEEHGASEENVPEKILTTRPSSDKRESGQPQPILPVVEESSEVHSTGGRSRDGDYEEHRPVTPSKAGVQGRPSGYNNKDQVLPPPTQPPPTPPKNLLKPESQDSGYGTMATSNRGNENGDGTTSISRDSTLKVLRRPVSRDSLNKVLPPLPGEVDHQSHSRGAGLA